MHACIHTYMHTYMHTCTHAHMHAHMHTCMHTCTHAHMHAYMQEERLARRKGSSQAADSLTESGRLVDGNEVQFMLGKAEQQVTSDRGAWTGSRGVELWSDLKDDEERKYAYGDTETWGLLPKSAEAMGYDQEPARSEYGEEAVAGSVVSDMKRAILLAEQSAAERKAEEEEDIRRVKEGGPALRHQLEAIATPDPLSATPLASRSRGGSPSLSRSRGPSPPLSLPTSPQA